MTKARVSIEWLSGCSGCELGIVDLHEKLLAVLAGLDIVRLPILMDEKNYPEADIGIITGSIRSEHDISAARKMRASCQAIMAFGTCPVYGGPQSAGYAHTKAELIDGSFCRNPTTRTTDAPTGVPPLLEANVPLDAEIAVDLYLPGCPPHPAFIFDGLSALLEQRSPAFGRHNVCFNCDRTMVKTDVTQVRRAHERSYDPTQCFLSQGCLCFGSVTLDRCLAPCMKVGVPCFSCGGPSESIMQEPQKDVRSEVAERMAHLTKIERADVMHEIEAQAKTHFAYAMASPVFRQKPTFLLRKWVRGDRAPAPAAKKS
ncbi:MAG: methyl viologen-reducing hydrogenase [Myxococcales bacterium]|nr:methyl viologen-reducing hydrogenase [Myxococcales bacterium]